MLSYGNFIFRYRNSLFPLVFVILFLVSKPTLFLGNEILDFLLVEAGVLMVAAGVSFRLLVIGYAYIKRGGKEGRVFADRLVIRGFYAHTRNPMYIGNMLVVSGLSLVYGSWGSTLFAIPFFCFSYLSIVVAEETYLKSQFGTEYDDYMKRVNRFWPNFHGLKESLKEFRYDWKRALRKDYGTTFGAIVLLLLTLTWKHYEAFGVRIKAKAFLLNPLFILLVIFYVIARYLKKSGRLASPN